MGIDWFARWLALFLWATAVIADIAMVTYAAPTPVYLLLLVLLRARGKRLTAKSTTTGEDDVP